MTKEQELFDPQSCLSRAKIGEMTFVLLARDRLSPIVVYLWCVLRVTSRKNKWRDKQIQSALACAAKMREQYRNELPFLKS